MPSILRAAIFLGLPAASICAIRQEPENLQDLEHLKHTFNEVPEASAKAILHDNLAPKYRDGVFQDRHQALEAVHSDDPSLASKLVESVMVDLRKRQNDNATTSATPDPDPSTSSTPDPDPTTSAAPDPEPSTSEDNTPTTTADNSGDTTTAVSGGSDDSTTTGVLVPITQTTTNDAGDTEVQTTSAFQGSAATSAVVQVTSTDDSGSEVVTSATVPAQEVETTNAQGQTITSASPLSAATVAAGGSLVGGNNDNNGGNGGGSEGSYTTTDRNGNEVVLSGTSGEVITTTNARGRTVVMTFTPGGGHVSELVVQTTRLDNGQQSTITSFAVVGGATNTRGVAGAGSDPEETGRPGLQNGVAAPTAKYMGEIAALLGCAVGLAALL